jgi:hypothetical protein
LYLTGGMVRAGMFFRRKKMFDNNKAAIRRFMVENKIDRVICYYADSSFDEDPEFFRGETKVECPQGRIDFLTEEGRRSVHPETAFILHVEQALELAGHADWKDYDEFGEVDFSLSPTGELMIGISHNYQVTVTKTAEYKM